MELECFNTGHLCRKCREYISYGFCYACLPVVIKQHLEFARKEIEKEEKEEITGADDAYFNSGFNSGMERALGIFERVFNTRLQELTGGKRK